MPLTLTEPRLDARTLLDQAREEALRALASGELANIREALAARGLGEEGCFSLLQRVTESPSSTARIHPLRATLAAAHGEAPPGALERVLLLNAMLKGLPRMATAPVGDSVKRLFADEVRMVAAPPASVIHRFDATRNVFVAFCKVATLRRFPAGQLHWELSGFPRSWLLQVKTRDLPRVAACLARMGGLAPLYQIHLNANRKDRTALLERESNRSYYRMAQSLALQPRVKGLVTASWLHSPDTLAVSPHLMALNRVFLEHGALVTTLGPAELDCGVFTRSPERRRLYEQGRFTPTTGLVLWPRRDMLAWAAAHPELAD